MYTPEDEVVAAAKPAQLAHAHNQNAPPGVWGWWKAPPAAQQQTSRRVGDSVTD